MAIYGIGAYYNEDVSTQFVNANLIGVGWSVHEAPELHEFIRALKVGDIVYIKSFGPSASVITVKGIGIITDNKFLNSAQSKNLVEAGRNIRWLSKDQFDINPPTERNNVRRNTLYEEWHPVVQQIILNRILSELEKPAR